VERRDLLKGTAVGSLAALAGGMLSGQVAAADNNKLGGEAGQALTELQNTLNEMEASFATPQWKLRTPEDFAEARRVTLHALLHGLEAWLEADPARPFFTLFIHQHKKLLGDNPDSRYYSTVISDQHQYRIRGNLAGATYTSFTIELGQGVDGDGIGSTINDSEFESDENGDFEIVVSKDRVDGNWMRLPAGAISITSRHYYERKVSINNDRLHHIPLYIENLDGAGARKSPNDSDIAEGIRRVANFVKSNVVTMTEEKSPPWVSRVPNQFVPPKKDDSHQAITYAAKDNVYAMAPFVLGANQALVIRGRFPKCRFSNLVLFNRFLQTFDYETRQVSLNRAQTELKDDGSFEMIVAHRDPGRPNWLDTEGRPYGIMFWRFQLPEEEIEPLLTEVINLT